MGQFFLTIEIGKSKDVDQDLDERSESTNIEGKNRMWKNKVDVRELKKWREI